MQQCAPFSLFDVLIYWKQFIQNHNFIEQTKYKQFEFFVKSLTVNRLLLSIQQNKKNIHKFQENI